MDQAHKTLFDHIRDVVRASDQEFASHYLLLIAAIERDFQEEEALMDQLDAALFRAHIEQHARVLSALHHTVSSIQEGDLGMGRETLLLLPQWLISHILTMDMALAKAVQEGSPADSSN